MIFLGNSDQAHDESFGKKAEGLLNLIRKGFNVPEGFVLSSHQNLDRQSLEEGILKIGGYPVAVRSSGSLEDLDGASFAGLYETYLSVENVDQLMESISLCFDSLHSSRVREYLDRKNFKLTDEDLRNTNFSVLVQKQVDVQYAGVFFTIDPRSGKERESLIECCSGLGEKLVSGHISPTRYVINNHSKAIVSHNKADDIEEDVNLTSEMLDQLVSTSLDIQKEYGKAQDIEWAIDRCGELWILQSRPITYIQWRRDLGEFTNADLKDGGISSKVCTPLMFSLYDFAMAPSMQSYFSAIKLINKNEKIDWLIYQYGRGYWNVGRIKEALARIPGFDEESFDKDLGIQKKYGSTGPVKTSTNLKTILSAIPILIGLNREFKACEKMIEKFHIEFNELDHHWKNEISNFSKKSLDELKKEFILIIKEYYAKVEPRYFRVIYNNSNYQTIYKEFLQKIQKAFNEEKINLLNLMSSLSGLSHLEIQKDLQKLYTVAKSSGMSGEEWKNSLNNFLKEHYHHGDRELDLLEPRWGEVPERVEEIVKSFIDSKCEPISSEPSSDLFDQEYHKVLKKLNENLFSRLLHRNKFIVMTKRSRKFLVNREKMREYSTRSYYIVRKYVLELGQRMYESGEIEKQDDLFYLPINEIISLCEKTYDNKSKVAENRDYYESFRLFDAPNEFGEGVEQLTQRKELNTDGTFVYQGVGCSPGSYTGKARVIFSPNEINTIEKGEILVTKFTDPGWTPVLGVVSGVVTEVGGVLSHAAIISREYGIPAVLNITGITKNVKTGDTITIDGNAGQVILQD